MIHSFKVRKRAPHRIEIFVDRIEQLFNSMDPSPFHEKDLDHDAEEFIVSWAKEYPRSDPLTLIVHVNQAAEAAGSQELVEKAVRNYFAYRGKLNRMEFKHLLKQGRTSLVIGLLFLAACLLISELMFHQKPGTLAQFDAREPDHCRLGGDVAADADFSLRLVAASARRTHLRKTEPCAGRIAKAGRRPSLGT